MPKQDKSAKQLAAELEGLRRRAARLEAVVPKLQRVQAALRDAVNRFNVLFDRTPLACCVLRLDGTLADCNPAAEKFTGYRTAECIGTNLGALGLLKGHDLFKAARNLKKNQTGEPSGPDVFTLHRKEREPAVAEISSYPINIRGDKFILSIVRDITDQKKSEEERLKLEAQLRQAQKMEAIGILAGGIAHDFNNILSAIIGYADLIEMYARQEDSNIRSSLAELLKACFRAKNLVRQILTFSRQTEQRKVPLEVAPIVKEALRLLRSSLPATIEIRQDIAADLGIVLADPTQIHQILVNLCANAGHAMRRQGGILDVHLANFEIDSDTTPGQPHITPGSYLELTVRDTGHGVSGDIMERIFDPYFTTKDKGEGTGLGLAVVHGIIKSHGGEITVKSEMGKGTTFKVYLPVIENGVEPAYEDHTPMPGGNERILYVDDEEVLVDVGRLLLERFGYRVTTAKSSAEALEAFRAAPNKFDLVITDMTMPMITGDNLARKLIGIRSDIPIILCTGFSELITRDRAVEIGIRDFLMKPLSAKILAHTVRKVLDID